jgi:hypothetical protein
MVFIIKHITEIFWMLEVIIHYVKVERPYFYSFKINIFNPFSKGYFYLLLLTAKGYIFSQF